RWIPPTDISQLPPGIDPATFSIAVAWIEFIDRILAMGLGVIILAFTFFAIKEFRRYPLIYIPAALATALALGQAWMGAVIISSGMNAALLIIHFVQALALVSALIVSFNKAGKIGKPQTEVTKYPDGIRAWLMILASLAGLQILLGLRLRQALGGLIEEFPDLSAFARLEIISGENIIHIVLGILVISLAGHIWAKIIKRSAGAQLSSLTRAAAFGLVVAGATQFILGILLEFIGGAGPFGSVHAWIAAVLFGLIILLYSDSSIAKLTQESS
ncbi:MAG: COX15/CtaA family protein, partial [candidate division Zixibacteria bacterium]|nr:COX15/CtaA family protein [candidate division Zixibacteria bacterium]